MQLKQAGIAIISRALLQELEKRFDCFLEPTSEKFNPIYIVATSLDLRYRVVLSESQLSYAKTYLKRKCISEPNVSGYCV